jgi:hypothetical protein
VFEKKKELSLPSLVADLSHSFQQLRLTRFHSRSVDITSVDDGQTAYGIVKIHDVTSDHVNYLKFALAWPAKKTE